MRYLFCIIPPLAVLSCGKPGQFLVSVVLTLCLYFPGFIHALGVVHNYYADRRTDRLVNAISKSAPGSAVAPQPQIAKGGFSIGLIVCGIVLFAVIAAMAKLGSRTRTDKSASAEPAKPVLTAADKSAHKPASGPAISTATPKPSPTANPTPAKFEIASVTSAESPKAVTLNSGEAFPASNGSGTVTAPPGTRVDVISRTGEMLRIKFLGGLKDVHYTKTSFAADVEAVRERAAQVARAEQERAEQARLAKEAAAKEKEAAEQSRIQSEAGKKPINSSWDKSVPGVKIYLEDHLKDPKSTEYIEWSPVKLIETGGHYFWEVRVRYRSKNSFGAYVIGEGIAEIQNSQVVSYRPISK